VTRGRTQQTDERGALADLGSQVAALFDRYPLLSGFSVQESPALCISDLAIVWPDPRIGTEVGDGIAQALRELLDEHPEAAALLRGRTFARNLH
jgi:hypothetical protein